MNKLKRYLRRIWYNVVGVPCVSCKRGLAPEEQRPATSLSGIHVILCPVCWDYYFRPVTRAYRECDELDGGQGWDKDLED